MYAVGDNGTIVFSDGGAFKVLPSPTREHLRGVYACDNTIFATGYNEMIIRSVGGAPFTAVPSPWFVG